MPQLLEQHEKLIALCWSEVGGDPALVQLDAAPEARHERTSGARQPKAVGTPVSAAATLDQATVLQRIDDSDHGRAVEAYGLREAALRHAGIGLDQKEHPRAPRRERGDARREIAEHRLLRAAQTIAEQPGKHPGAKRRGAAHLFGIQTICYHRKLPTARMQINLEGRAAPVAVEPGDTILASLLRAGVPFPFSCQAGNCGTCKCELVSGDVLELEHSEHALAPEERAKGVILACRTQVWEDTVIRRIDAEDLVMHPSRVMRCRVLDLQPLTHDIRAKATVEPLGITLPEVHFA